MCCCCCCRCRGGRWPACWLLSGRQETAVLWPSWRGRCTSWTSSRTPRQPMRPEVSGSPDPPMQSLYVCVCLCERSLSGSPCRSVPGPEGRRPAGQRRVRQWGGAFHSVTSWSAQHRRRLRPLPLSSLQKKLLGQFLMYRCFHFFKTVFKACDWLIPSNTTLPTGAAAPPRGAVHLGNQQGAPLRHIELHHDFYNHCRHFVLFLCVAPSPTHTHSCGVKGQRSSCLQLLPSSSAPSMLAS